MKKIRGETWLLFYILFTAICDCLSLVYPAGRSFVIQVWYQISVVLWIFFAVTMVRLLIRLEKINKFRMREINERSEEP